MTKSIDQAHAQLGELARTLKDVVFILPDSDRPGEHVAYRGAERIRLYGGRSRIDNFIGIAREGREVPSPVVARRVKERSGGERVTMNITNEYKVR